MAIGNHNDLTHIVRTSDQWKNTYDKYELIPTGVLCVELVSSDVTKIKIGDGHNIFSKLPYIGDLDLSKYYTKLETDTRIKEILTQEKVVRIKGILNSKSDLPADARCGDIYFVRQLSSSDNKYIEYIYSPDNTWEPLGGIPVDIDLSEYAKTAYVDDKIEQVNERIDDIEQHGTHTHPNKEILDQITEPYTTADKETLASLHNYDDTEIREMISQSSHTHANKDILDATSAAFTREDKSKLDQLNPYDDSILKEKITALERLAHEHSNKRILDQTTASFTKEYERKMRWIRIYTGCTGMEEGIAGLVPAAQAGEEDYVLSGAGEWVPQTGGGGTYTLPIATASTLGGIKVGDGLSIDPATGVLSATGGGGGGDSIAEGGGINITTDPQTGVKTISVNTGDNLEIDPNTGELNVTGIDYTAGEAINIRNTSGGNLPSGYVEVDYIEGNGNCYTVIDYIPNRKTKIVGSAALTGTTNDPVLFGARTGSSGNQFVFWFNRYDSTQAKVGFVYGTNTWSTSTDCNDGRLIPYVIGEQFTFLLSLDDEFNINDTFVHNITENGAPADYLKLGIFALVDDSLGNIESDNQIFAGRMYEFKIYEDDVLVVELIPAVNSTTGSVGFYDTVNDKFYTSNRSTQFTYDPSTIHVSGKSINVKYGNGLVVNQNNELEVNIGDGINVDEYGEISLSTGEGLDIDFALPIPSEYTLVKGISSAGHNDLPYINTGYLIKPTSRIIARGVLYKTNSGWAFPIGVRHNNYSDPVMFCTRHNSNGDSIELWLPNDTLIATATDREKCYNDPVTITISSDGLNIENETTGEVVTLTTSSALPTATLPLYIFATNDNYTLAFPGSMDLYRLQIFEGTTKVLDYLPCKRNSDNKYGVYDVVAHEYKASSNSASFEPVAGTPSGDDLIQQIKLLPATENTIGGVKQGDGILVDNNGTISVDPTIIPEVPTYEAGTAISIINNGNPYITKVRWTISDIRGTSDSWIQMRYFGFYNENQERLVIQSGLGEWSDDSAVTYYQHRTLNAMIDNLYEMTASSWDGTKSFILTFNLPTGTRLNDLKYFRYQTGDDETHRDPVSWEIHAYSDELDAWFLLNAETNATIPTGRDTWTDYFDLEYVPVTTIDVWNGGTGWMNGDYYSGDSDNFTTNWYYTYHYNPSEYIQVPEGATHVMVQGISNENDSHFEGGGVNVFNSDHSHHTGWWACAWEWHELTSDVGYIQPEVKWNNNNTRTISANDIKSITLVWKMPALSTSQQINVKYGNGLVVNQNNELEVNLGAGLQFDANGALEVVGGGGGDTIAEGDGIEITTDQQTGVKTIAVNVGNGLEIDPITGSLNVTESSGGGSGDYSAGEAIDIQQYTLTNNIDAIRWDISDIKNAIQQGGPYTQIRSVEFCDSSNVVHILDSGSAIWEDGTTVTYAAVGETIDELVADTGKMCASWRYPDHTLKLTFNLDTPTPPSDIVKFRMKTANDTPERDPKAWEIYVRDSVTQRWYLVHKTSNAEITNDRNTWSNYYNLSTPSDTSINVKYGTGLSVDPITNELFVDGQLPEGTILKKLTYMGNGSTSANNIQFSKKPLAIMSIYGSSGTNYISSNPAPIDAPYLMGDYGGVNTNNTCNCAMSYNDTTNVLTLSPGYASSGDAGLLYNVNGRTYTVWYLVKGHTGEGTSETNEVSVVKTFSYVGTGTATNNIQFPETPDTLITIYGVAVNNDISSNTVPITARYLMGEYGSGGSQQYGVVSCNMSFNNTTNILTLTGGIDAGARYNVSGETYTVVYSVNEVIASSNYVEGDGIEIDPVTGEISVNIGTGLAFDPQTGAINVTGGGGGSGDTVAEGAGIEITTDQQTGNKVIAVNPGSGLQVNQTTNELEPKLGDGLELDEYNAITVDPFYPNTLILNCVLDDEPSSDLILHFTLDPDE